VGAVPDPQHWRELKIKKSILFADSRRTQRRRATVLRNEQEIAAALDVSTETEELLSRAGSLEQLARCGVVDPDGRDTGPGWIRNWRSVDPDPEQLFV
jgi:hypothetical protein